MEVTLLQTAIEKYQQAIKSTLTESEARIFEAGWTACMVEFWQAEEELELKADSE